MSKQHFAVRRVFGAILAGLALHVTQAALEAQQSPVHFRVEGPTQRLEMLVNTSRILTLPHDVPRMLVNNTDIVEATPLAPNQVQVSAKEAGVTQLNMWDEDKKVYTVDLIVNPDARELEHVLRAEFPEASLKIRPAASSVIISGFVPRPEMVGDIVEIAEDYYGKVVNRISVGGVQQVLLHVKVMEVSRSKLRSLGIDWAAFGDDISVASGVSGIISASGATAAEVTTSGSETVAVSLVHPGHSLFGLIEAMRRNRVAKVLAEPTFVTISGRPASFQSGGEFAYDVSQGLGAVATQFREFGTRVDFVPIVLGGGRVRLEVRPQVSEVDFTLASASGVPGLRNRWVDTAVEMKAGQTLALAGLIQTRTEMENRGLPVLADMPWIGGAFRKVEENLNEVELLILVTPEFVGAMEPHEVPPCGPGQFTGSPTHKELYGRGYLETPNCVGPCVPGSGVTAPGASMGIGPYFESGEVMEAPGVGVHDISYPAGDGGNMDSPSPPEAAQSRSQSEPELIGPVGYDAID